jgi:hypothetical protein
MFTAGIFFPRVRITAKEGLNPKIKTPFPIFTWPISSQGNPEIGYIYSAKIVHGWESKLAALHA